METLEAQARTHAFAGQPGTSAGVGGAYGGEVYGTDPTQAGYAPGDSEAGGSQYAKAIAQHDQYITQLQQETSKIGRASCRERV